MKYIIRPKENFLALMDTDEGLITYGLPDQKFWEWLHSSGNYDEMMIENPERMKRVEKNGVGRLRNEKEELVNIGFTIKDITDKRPVKVGVEPRAVLIKKEKPKEIERK